MLLCLKLADGDDASEELLRTVMQEEVRARYSSGRPKMEADQEQLVCLQNSRGHLVALHSANRVILKQRFLC